MSQKKRVPVSMMIDGDVHAYLNSLAKMFMMKRDDVVNLILKHKIKLWGFNESN